MMKIDEGCFLFKPSNNSSAFHRNNHAYQLRLFREIKQEGTGLRPVLPLALRGKAFGFSALPKSTVITLAIAEIDIQF